ncbi:MAG: hypothetical protein KIT84_38650 [Labilithrix sp.]|nr:hypothetical protein [Labilithrix sp.]MCW5816981.1 hypothetical protein [Labilithrix sp.]
MRRLTKSVVVAIALVLAWACGDGYAEAPATPQEDAGVDASRDVTTVLEASVVQPSLVLGTTAAIPRGESGTIPVSIVRGAHPGALVVAVSGLPAGVSAPAATIEPGSSSATLTINVANDAPEGAVSLDVALLSGSEKLATAATVITIDPPRPGTLDPTFGNDGFVDLDIPPTLVAFASDGALYVDAASGLARWTKDGVRDAAYGPLTKPASQTFWAMTVTDNGQVYFSGYASALNASSPIVVRTSTDGKSWDATFAGGGPAIVKTAPGAKYATAIALAVLPTSIYAVTKVEEDSTGNPGPFTIARMDSGGASDPAYGTGGYRQLPSAVSGELAALLAPIAIDHYLVAAPHVSAGVTSYFLHEGTSAGLVLRSLDEGTPAAIAFHPAGTYVAKTADAGAGIVRIGDAGVDPSFGGATGIRSNGEVRALSVDADGRPLTAGCRDGAAAWDRYLPDGGADPAYRAGTTTELTCIRATRTTDKYVYLAGTGGPLNYLRIARLLR